MTAVLNPDELLRARLHALGLKGTPDYDPKVSSAERIAQTARHMLAVQSQDWRSSRWALGHRVLPGAPKRRVERRRHRMRKLLALPRHLVDVPEQSHHARPGSGRR